MTVTEKLILEGPPSFKCFEFQDKKYDAQRSGPQLCPYRILSKSVRWFILSYGPIQFVFTVIIHRMKITRFAHRKIKKSINHQYYINRTRVKVTLEYIYIYIYTRLDIIIVVIKSMSLSTASHKRALPYETFCRVYIHIYFFNLCINYTFLKILNTNIEKPKELI